MKRCPRFGRVFPACVVMSLLVSGSLPAADWNWKEGKADITLLDEGKVDAAIGNLEKRLEGLPNHGEVLFGLAAAYARKGDIDKAMFYVKRALEAGLPFERFVAGPREMLEPLTGSPPFRELAKEHPVELLHGPMLGAVTDRSARFWVRTANEVPVQVVARKARSLGIFKRKSETIETRAGQDYTAVLSIDGLKPDTPYSYRLVVDGEKRREMYNFRTFPKAGNAAKFDVAFGGGAAYTPDFEHNFDTVALRRPIAFLQLGDNCYIQEPEKPNIHRYCYYRRHSSAPYRRLISGTCVASIWDDHDFVSNDKWGGPEIDTPPWKRVVWNIFRENWNNPSYGGGEKHPGCYFDFVIGDVHFIMLDCRYYRTDPRSENPSMIGPVQKAWFFDRLKKSKATFKVIASSVPFAPGVKPGSRDPWDGFPAEREAIFSFFEDNKIDGIVLIAADRHRSDAWKIERPHGYDLYEFQSSRLTNIHTHPVMKASLFGYNKNRSFGLLSFDTTKADPEVTYTIVNIQNRPIWSLTLKRSMLEHNR